MEQAKEEKWTSKLHSSKITSDFNVNISDAPIASFGSRENKVDEHVFLDVGNFFSLIRIA